MREKFLRFCVVVVASAVSILAQGLDQDQPTGNRLINLLRHPTFISLRLSTVNYGLEKSTDTPAPYYEKAFISFQLFMTQNSPDSITIWSENDPYYRCTPLTWTSGTNLSSPVAIN